MLTEATLTLTQPGGVGVKLTSPRNARDLLPRMRKTTLFYGDHQPDTDKARMWEAHMLGIIRRNNIFKRPRLADETDNELGSVRENNETGRCLIRIAVCRLSVV